MVSAEHSPLPALYLDVDGVVLVGKVSETASPFADYGEYDNAYYDRRVVGALGELIAKTEVVWVTTWEDTAHYVTREFGWPPLRFLPLDRDRSKDARTSISVKLPVVKEDLGSSGRPFVWVDDQITPAIVADIDESYSQPHLLISPDKRFGVQEADISKMEQFLAALAV